MCDIPTLMPYKDKEVQSQYCKVWRLKNRETDLIKQRERHRQRRIGVMSHYTGDKGMVCDCCGEKTIEFLVLDHINGGGTQHRKKVGSGTGFFLWIIKNNYPSGYRILCHNCNHAVWVYGKCPHQAR